MAPYFFFSFLFFSNNDCNFIQTQQTTSQKNKNKQKNQQQYSRPQTRPKNADPSDLYRFAIIYGSLHIQIVD